MCTHDTLSVFFFFNDTATTEIYTLSLHDALPICSVRGRRLEHAGANRRRQPELEYSSAGHRRRFAAHQRLARGAGRVLHRSEEHTSELQSPCNLVCRLLLEKKKNKLTLTLIWTHI